MCDDILGFNSVSVVNANKSYGRLCLLGGRKLWVKQTSEGQQAELVKCCE